MVYFRAFCYKEDIAPAIIRGMKRRQNVFLSLLFLFFLGALLVYNEWQQFQEGETGERARAVEPLLCTVVSVADGDTLTAECDESGKSTRTGGTRVRVRLMAIDAPEYDYKVSANIQPYGRESREHLKRLCLHVRAEVFVYYTDQYGRSVADVVCHGMDVSEAQIGAGMAWVYDRYAAGYKHLYVLQESAQRDKRGLWAKANPIPPWQWRSAHRQ